MFLIRDAKMQTPPAYSPTVQKEALIKLLWPPMTIISRTAESSETFTGNGPRYKAYTRAKEDILPIYPGSRSVALLERVSSIQDIDPSDRCSACNCLLHSPVRA